MSALQGALLVTMLRVGAARAELGGAEPAALLPPPPCAQPCPPEGDDEALLGHLRADTSRRLAAAGIDGSVSARVKSVPSVLAKMQRKGVPYEAIVDRLGLRVIVGTEAECYAVRDLLLDQYGAIEAEYDDYIAHPKANGYRSLHLALRAGPRGEVAEFQIRTSEMHAHAEWGGAAHRDYKRHMAQGLSESARAPLLA